MSSRRANDSAITPAEDTATVMLQLSPQQTSLLKDREQLQSLQLTSVSLFLKFVAHKWNI